MGDELLVIIIKWRLVEDLIIEYLLLVCGVGF